MIIKLSTGKELTMDEVKEVIEKFKSFSEPNPCPIYVYPTYPAVPMNPYYGGIQPYCQTPSSEGK